ncbi:MAG: DUF2118 domain-containing protein, partial [Burkholderiaceae bacterium]
VGAPMQGSVSSVAVKVGQHIKAGDPLVLIEAMKMETMIRAERDGIVAVVHVQPGDIVESKELLVEFTPSE